MAYIFSRDTKMYVELIDGAGAVTTNVFEIPILDGYSFSQSTNVSEVTLSEATNSSGESNRGKRVFTDSFAPAEFSFQTYVRPYLSAASASLGFEANGATAAVHVVDEVLWAMLLSDLDFTASSGGTNSSWGASVGSTGTALTVDTGSSDRPTLTRANIYFSLNGGAQVYKLTGGVMNEASIDFDLEGIAMVSWSGLAELIEDEGATVPTVTISDGISSTTSLIRNKVSTMSLNYNGSTPYANIILTGGGFTISNNITFLTPEELGKVNIALGHVTGSRSVSGNVTCYLDTAAGTGGALLAELQADTTTVTNVSPITINIGGAAGTGTPTMSASFPQSHIQLPSISVEDVLSVDIAFDALPTTIDASDEIVITFEEN